MIKISKTDEQILVSLQSEDDESKLKGLLKVIGSKFDETNNIHFINWKKSGYSIHKILDALKKMCKREKLEVSFDDYTQALVEKMESGVETADSSINAGNEVKKQENTEINLPHTFQRELLSYQRKPALHLYTVQNGANFSVPGSGKTTIALAAYSMMKQNNEVDTILVICPRSAFMSWIEEFDECFGKPPVVVRLRGNNILDNHGKIDIFLSTYQTMSQRTEEFIPLLQNQKCLMILDESHYIKNGKKLNQSSYSVSARELAPYAERRMILSGTPCPQALGDLWAQLDFLIPNTNTLGNYYEFSQHTKLHDGLGRYDQRIGGLFTRITKQELNLPEPHFEIIDIPMDPIQTKIYKSIEARTIELLQKETLAEHGKMSRFRGDRGGKLIRMIQAASNPELLTKSDDQFDLLSIKKLIDQETSELIENYAKYGHIPHKLMEACKKAKELAASGEKVIIWTSFLHNIQMIVKQLLRENVDMNQVVVIDGSVPKDEEDNVHDNREKRIKEFKEDPKCKILIATPPSCSESVSLHINSRGETVCKHAIYFDRTFNATHYMQSKDRIHRIGMKDDTRVTYWIYRSSHPTENGKEPAICYIDHWTHGRLATKETRMLSALGDEITTFDLNTNHQDMSQEEINADYVDFLNGLPKES